MFSWIKSLIGLDNRKKLNLEYTLDMVGDGKQAIEIYYLVDGLKKKIKDLEKLWDYGSYISANEKKYFVGINDIEILNSMKSLNPEIRADGSLIFDVCPPVLKYLRRKHSVYQSDRAKAVIIEETPLEPTATIDYEPNSTLEVKIGMKSPKTNAIHSFKNLHITPDLGYAKIDNSCFPLPEIKTDKTKELLMLESVSVPSQKIPEFFKRDLVLIKSNFSAVLNDQAKKISVIEESFEPIVKINTGEKGWLEFGLSYKAGNLILPFQDVSKCQNAYIQVDDYNFVELDNKAIEQTKKYLDVLQAESTANRFKVPVNSFYSLEEFIESIGGEKILSREYQKFLNEITGFQADETYSLPSSIESRLSEIGVRLRPYQRAGIHWLNWLSQHYLHGILADDMGLGKTIQTIISMILTRNVDEEDRIHSLIICPKSVVRHWARELIRCSPNSLVHEYVGSNRNRKVFQDNRHYTFITTYETATNDIEVLKQVPFRYLVLDEATKIKNPQAKRSKATKAINALHRVCLSGTPIENRPSELWSIFDFLMKNHLGSARYFEKTYGRPIVNGDKAAPEALSRRINPFVLRRLKMNVAKDLPEKIKMDEWCQLTHEQQSLYAQIQANDASPIIDNIKAQGKFHMSTNILTILMRLKQVCGHPALITKEPDPIFGRSGKFDLVFEKLKEIINNGEKVVIFSHFLGILDLFQKAVLDFKLTHIRIDGSTQNRQALIDRFNEGNDSVALCSLQASGLGITLTGANHVIHYDRWWNPAIEDQATDRVHRIGQDKTVYVYQFLTEDTLEEKIATLLEIKRSIADSVIGAAARMEMKWTKDDILELLKPL